MTVTVLSQTAISYAQVQGVLRILPDAIAETFDGVTPNLVKAAQAITSVVTGLSPAAFFCVALLDGDVAGFLGGMIESDLFSDRRFARDVAAWVRPSARGTTAYRDMVAAFEAWAINAGVNEVRGTLMNGATSDAIATAAERYGYARAGIVLVKKVA